MKTTPKPRAADGTSLVVPSNSKYDPYTIERGLTELALAGTGKRARQRLLRDGINVPERTLLHWKTSAYADRYLEIVETRAKRIEEQISNEARASALLAAEIEMEALEATRTLLRSGEAKDPSTIARNAATVKGINVDKLLALSGRPTQITEHRDVREIAIRLKGLGIEIAVPQVVDAEVVEELPARDSGELHSSEPGQTDAEPCGEDER